MLDTEAVYPAYSIDTAKPPKEIRLRPGRVTEADIVYAFSTGVRPPRWLDVDVIYATIFDIFYPLTAAFVAGDDAIPSPFMAMAAQPALVAADDAIYGGVLSLFLVPELLADADEVPAADVGWQVEASFTDDADAIYGPDVLAIYELLPDIYLDEESIETYPFFLQQLTGGIPQPKPIGLTGSLSQRRRLTGSIDSRRRLTGSISPRIGKRKA